jgi:hypothetical protein
VEPGENLSALIAATALTADPATLRRAIAAALDQCDSLHESKTRYREIVDGQSVGGNARLHALCETRADVYEDAVENLEEALIEAFGLWDIVAPEPDP